MRAEHFGAGTLSYMAPELLKGSTASPSLTDKVDIYALGIMLWELATRQLPWRGCSDVQVQALVSAAASGTMRGGGGARQPAHQPAHQSLTLWACR